MLQVFIKSALVFIFIILCKCIKNLYNVYTWYPKDNIAKGYIAWGIVSEVILMIYIFIKIVT